MLDKNWKYLENKYSAVKERMVITLDKDKVEYLKTALIDQLEKNEIEKLSPDPTIRGFAYGNCQRIGETLCILEEGLPSDDGRIHIPFKNSENERSGDLYFDLFMFLLAHATGDAHIC